MLELLEEVDDQVDLGRVEFCYRDFEFALVPEVPAEFTAGAIVKLAT